jgi:hypothetical protein
MTEEHRAIHTVGVHHQINAIKQGSGDLVGITATLHRSAMTTNPALIR